MATPIATTSTAIGAILEESAAPDAGAAYVTLGGDVGTLSLGSAYAKYTGEAEDDKAGEGVAGGDFNGDGFVDIAVGAPGEQTYGENTGAVYITYGPASGTHSLSSADAKIVGIEHHDVFGFTMTRPGDFDGDGIDDLLVGAIGAGPNNTGAAYVFYGPAVGNLESTDADIVFEDLGDYSEFGYSLDGSGDVDGDGHWDLVIGARFGHNSETGASAYVYLAPFDAYSTSTDADGRLYEESLGSCAGISVAIPGDTNLDGADDILIGAWQDSQVADDSGSAYLVLGSP